MYEHDWKIEHPELDQGDGRRSCITILELQNLTGRLPFIMQREGLPSDNKD